ncbi:MAG TPA: hypothetical protein VKA78_12285 [Pyrinomonadaceae bacterium]|nr:hypothetical protein [Pyrinomonadaceae bacterium]
MTYNNSPIACNMTVIPPEQRPAHLATSRDLFSQIEELRELSNGYEFRFASESSLLLKLAEFVSLEKLCCPFLSFMIEVDAEGGPVWLRMIGRDGVKAFIREEINGLLGVTINWSQDFQND